MSWLLLTIWSYQGSIWWTLRYKNIWRDTIIKIDNVIKSEIRLLPQFLQIILIFFILIFNPLAFVPNFNVHIPVIHHFDFYWFFQRFFIFHPLLLQLFQVLAYLFIKTIIHNTFQIFFILNLEILSWLPDI